MPKVNLGEFCQKYSGTTVNVPEPSEELRGLVPPLDEKYKFDEGLFDKLLLWLKQPGVPLWVLGPHGAGKTSLMLQLAARFHKPVVIDNGSPDREAGEMIAMPGLSDGESTTVYGGLAQAAKYGCWYLLNEADLLRPGVMASLNTVLDGTGVLTVPFSGEQIQIHPGFRFIVTANSGGKGDLSGNYQVEQQNAALMDRFLKVRVGYPAPEVEDAIIAERFPSVPEEVRGAFIRFANALRDAFAGKSVSVNGQVQTLSLSVTLSTRSLLRWLEMIQLSGGALSSFECLSMVLGLEDDVLEVDREAVRSLYETYIGDEG